MKRWMQAYTVFIFDFFALMFAYFLTYQLLLVCLIYKQAFLFGVIVSAFAVYLTGKRVDDYWRILSDGRPEIIEGYYEKRLSLETGGCELLLFLIFLVYYLTMLRPSMLLVEDRVQKVSMWAEIILLSIPVFGFLASLGPMRVVIGRLRSYWLMVEGEGMLPRHFVSVIVLVICLYLAFQFPQIIYDLEVYGPKSIELNRNMDYSMSAKDTQNKSYCTMITNEGWRESCYAEVDTLTAYLERNRSICGSINDMGRRNGCFTRWDDGIARLNDSTLCGGIIDGESRTRCLELVVAPSINPSAH